MALPRNVEGLKYSMENTPYYPIFLLQNKKKGVILIGGNFIYLYKFMIG